MKVFLVTSYMKSKGGVARVVWSFAEYLSSRNDDVVIISLFVDRNLFQAKKGIKIIDLADESTLPQSINFWFNLKKLEKSFSNFVNKENPDVILFNDFPATLWAHKFKHIPSLCYTHDIHMLYTNTYINNLPFMTRLLWRFFRIFIRKFDQKKWSCFNQILCNSKFMSNYIKKTYKRESTVVYPGIDTETFSPPSELSKKRAILTMGDLKVRRADFLLYVAEKIRKKRNDFEIWIVGPKTDEEEILRNISRKYHVEDLVHFFGRINDDSKLAKIYSESLVLTHLVPESAFGYTAGESMSCETPVIAWKPSGLEELIEDGVTGFNVDQNNPEILMKYIEKFLDEPKLSIEMGKKARLRIINFIQKDEKFNELRNILKHHVEKS